MTLKLSIEFEGIEDDALKASNISMSGKRQGCQKGYQFQGVATEIDGRSSLGDPADLRALLPPDDPMSSQIQTEHGDFGGRESQALHVRHARESRTVMPSASLHSKHYSGNVIVSLSSFVPFSSHSSTLVDLAGEFHLEGLKQVLEKFHSPPSEPAITSGGPAQPAPCGEQSGSSASPSVSLEDLEGRAAANGISTIDSLRRYWIVAGPIAAVMPEGAAAPPPSGLGYSVEQLTQSFVEQLNALPEIDLAYRELTPSDPDDEELSPDELSDFQLHHGPSPLGLNVRWARERLGNGEDVESVEKITVADVEQGWTPDREDLADLESSGGTDVTLIHGDNRHGFGDYRGNHGVAVLSELAGRKGNKLGIVGIASGICRVVVASHYVKSSDTVEDDRADTVEDDRADLVPNGRVADAIVALMCGVNPALKAGDLLLLEVQRAGRPTECDRQDFLAIRLAVANGIIVVEAAGNGGFDLDRLAQTADGRSFNRKDANFQDSGAIMVGAGRAALPHNRAHFSNHGSRIDCFAWGDRVLAAGYGDYIGGDEAKQIYTDRFSGTSSAAATIAGVAVLIQSLYCSHAGVGAVAGTSEEESWDRLAPGQMRSLLSDAKNGTPQGPAVPGHIGVMPDLRAILDSCLGIAPRVYLRDHVGDTGQTPFKQRDFASPDIIVSQETEVEESTLGEGSGTENSQNPGLAADSTGDRKLFVRMRNRGLQQAKKVQATVYKAEISTLVTPDRWTKVGDTSSEPMPAGDVLKVSKVNIIPGPQGQVENHCLVAVIEHDGGPEAPVPCHKSHFNWQRYLTMMRTQSNIALRNVHALSCKCEFTINGTPDAARAFEFEVIQRLPSNVTVQLTAPTGLAFKLSRGRLGKPTEGSGSGLSTLQLPKPRCLRFNSVTLPPGVGFPCSFELTDPGLSAGHSLAIRQLYRGEVVGRIEWRFQPSA